MIKINFSNKETVEISQELENGNINVDVLDGEGNLDYYYTVKPHELVKILNNYQLENNRI